jgi:regulator of nucleoside diphosphate kinase
MPTTPRCILTSKGHTILEVLFERRVNPDECFLQLLRQKLATATTVFQDDLGEQVATINSRVDFSVDGKPLDNRILVHAGDDAYRGLSLPITTLRGLALMGLTAGDTITVACADGQMQTIHLEAVSYQPEAADRESLRQRYHQLSLSTRQVPHGGATIISLTSRRRAVAKPFIDDPVEPDDDDPGPRAA